MPTSAPEPGRGPGRGTPDRPRPTPDRLRRTADYQRVQGLGKKARSGNLLLVYAPGLGPASRLGYTVSRKVGNAVERNRVKRWIREASRRVELPAGVWDLVIIPNRAALAEGLLVLTRSLAELLRRIRA